MTDVVIIIPAYNAEKYIERCLLSLIAQETTVSYTLEVIDDGSNDATYHLLQHYQKKYPDKVHIFKKGNGGQSSARNYGLNHSISEYVMFVDSDDYVESDYIDVLYKLITDTNSDIAMCAMNRVAGDNGIGSRFDSGFTEDFVTNDIDRILLVSSFSPGNKIYKRSTIGELRFPEGMTYEDFALIPQIINRARKIAYTDKVLYHYYLNNDSTIASAAKNRRTDRNIIRAQHILEESELRAKPEILENFYLRRVLSSMAWSLLEYREGKDLVQQLVDEGVQKYPNIRQNPYIEKQPRMKRAFLQLILNGKFACGGGLVSLYSTMRSTYQKFKKVTNRNMEN